MANTDGEKRLSDEDARRVEEYLSGPVQSVDRKPFKPLWLLFWLWVVVSLLGGVSWLLGKLEGFI